MDNKLDIFLSFDEYLNIMGKLDKLILIQKRFNIKFSTFEDNVFELIKEGVEESCENLYVIDTGHLAFKLEMGDIVTLKKLLEQIIEIENIIKTHLN